MERVHVSRSIIASRDIAGRLFNAEEGESVGSKERQCFHLSTIQTSLHDGRQGHLAAWQCTSRLAHIMTRGVNQHCVSELCH